MTKVPKEDAHPTFVNMVPLAIEFWLLNRAQHPTYRTADATPLLILSKWNKRNWEGLISRSKTEESRDYWSYFYEESCLVQLLDKPIGNMEHLPQHPLIRCKLIKHTHALMFRKVSLSSSLKGRVLDQCYLSGQQHISHNEPLLRVWKQVSETLLQRLWITNQ